MDPEAGKRRRDPEGDDAAGPMAPAPDPVKPRKRRFDTSGGGTGGSDAAASGASSVVHLQADIASLQQQVTALFSLAGVPEDQKSSAIGVLQGVISAKQAELTKAMAASGLGGAGVSAAFTPAGQPLTIVPHAAASAAMGARIYVGAMPYEATELDVRQLFSQFGNILKVDMSFEPTTGAAAVGVARACTPLAHSSRVPLRLPRQDEGLLLHRVRLVRVRRPCDRSHARCRPPGARDQGQPAQRARGRSGPALRPVAGDLRPWHRCGSGAGRWRRRPDCRDPQRGRRGCGGRAPRQGGGGLWLGLLPCVRRRRPDRDHGRAPASDLLPLWCDPSRVDAPKPGTGGRRAQGVWLYWQVIAEQWPTDEAPLSPHPPLLSLPQSLRPRPGGERRSTR